MRHWRPSLAVLALALAGAGPVSAVEVVWEKGALTGTASRVASPECATGAFSSGIFTFDVGDEELAGVDYFAANPGTFQVCYCCGAVGAWQGDFGAGGVTFGTTSGNYALVPSGQVVVGETLQLDGPITFSAPGYPALPPELTNLRVSSTSTVTEVFSQSYNFQGVFELKGDVPSVCGDALITGAEGCDDGNTATGDCCDAACQPEPYLSPCDVGPGGVCDGLGACVDPDDLTSQPGLYAWMNCDADFGIVGARGTFADAQLAGIALAVDPFAAKLYTGGRTLDAASSTDYTRPYKITRTNLDGSALEDYLVLGPPVPGANLIEVAAAAIDVGGGYLFWSDPLRGNLGRVSLTDPSDNDPAFLQLASGSRPLMLAVDEAADKLYWHDGASQTIRRVSTDGTNVENVIAVSLWTRSLAVDPIRGKLYWAESSPSGPIQLLKRANLDGSSPETVAYAPTPPRAIYDIDLDASANVLHLAESLRYRQLDLDTGSVTDPGDMSCSYDRITLDPSQASGVQLPGGSGVPGSLLGGPSSTGGLAAIFGQTTAGTLSASFERVAVADSTSEIGVDLAPIASNLASAPAQVWEMSYTGSLTGPFTLVLAYDEAAIGPGISEGNLRIRAWNGFDFVLLPGTVDEQANRITVVTDTLPAVAILGTASLKVMGTTGPWGRSVLVLTAPKRRCSVWYCFKPWRWFRPWQ